MEPDHEGREGGEIDVVQLIDGEEHPGVVIAGHLPELDEQSGEIAGEVPRICRPVHGVDLHVELGAIGEAQAERLQHAQGTARAITDTALGVHQQQDPAKGGYQARGERAFLGHFDVIVKEAPGIRQLFELVEQHGLPDTAQSREHLAPAVPTEPQALQRGVHGLDLAISPDEGRWPGTGPWAVGVAHRIHPRTLAPYTPLYGNKYSLVYNPMITAGCSAVTNPPGGASTGWRYEP